MKTPQLPPEDPALMLCLALLRSPIRARSLSQALERDESLVLGGLRALQRAKFVSHDRERGLWSAARDAGRLELGNLAAQLVQDAEPGSLADGLAHLWHGNILEGAARVGLVVRGLLRKDHSPGALLCLEIMLRSLVKWETDIHPPAENEQFVALSKEVFGAVLFMAKHRRLANALFPVLGTAAKVLGDKRTVLKVKMMQVSLHYIIGGVLDGTPEDVMEEAAHEVSEFGDDDIKIGASHVISLHHYMRGEFVEVIEKFRLYDSFLNDDERFYSSIALNNVAISACHLGRFSHAVGTVLHALRTYTDRGFRFSMKRTRILGSDVLLRAGKPMEALEMMDEAWACCDMDAESRLTVWALRNLSFYHFQMNNLAASHKLLTECAREAKRYNIQWPFRWFTDYFEMAWKFQELGLEPIPGHNINYLADHILNGPSIQSQGIALRIKARYLNKQKKYMPALALLESSLARLVQCRNPMEQARAKIEMARSMDGLGREEEAAALRAQGCSVLVDYNQYDRFWYCPEQNLPLNRELQANGEECAGRWRTQLTDSPEWASFNAHLQWIVDCLRDALRVERVALYTVENDYVLVALAARDFTAREYNDKLTFQYGKRLLDAIQSGKISRWRSRYSACLALPLRISNQHNGVLFAHCAYFVDSIMDRELAYFEPIRRMLEEEVRVSFRVKEGVTALQLKELTRSQLAAERSVNEGGIYYGPAMQEILEQADKAALTPAPVLILGETGAGKEELSRRIHRKSGRAGHFIVINPASIPEQLFESELFGHEKGAFTGAYQQKLGVIELADKGTLFIDEIGEIPGSLQVKLLRVLQDKKFMRLGGTQLLHSDFRLVSATNQDLKEKIRTGTFREDLYYRIAVVPLVIPPLRERPEEITHLAMMFHAHFATLYKVDLPPLTREELEYLCSRPWPGNIRELRSLIEREVILHAPSKERFLQELGHDQDGEAAPPAEVDVPAEPDPLKESQRDTRFICDDLPSLEELNKRYIAHVLRLTRGKVGGESGAERILDVRLSTLYKKMKKYGVDKPSLIWGSL